MRDFAIILIFLFCLYTCAGVKRIYEDVREIKEYLLPEIEEVTDTIYVHKKDTIIIHYDYRNEEE